MSLIQPVSLAENSTAPNQIAATVMSDTEPKTRSANRIQELDALRGIAALLVVLFHFTMFRPEAKYGFIYGVTGVDLFFIISGYVIFLTVSRAGNWRDFVVSRFARLYPAYWAAVLLTASLYYFLDPAHFFPKPILANMTMFQNFMGITDLDGSYWTLCVELLFYGLILLLTVSGQLNKVEKWGIFSLIILFVFHLTGTIYFSESYSTIREYLPIVNHAPLFLAGILFYNFQYKPNTWYRHIAIAGCLLFACYLHDKGGTALGAISAAEHYTLLFFYFVVFYLFVLNKLSFLVNRVTVFLGTISYSLYLIHDHLAVHVIIPYLESRGWSFLYASAAALATAITVATLITFLIERPANGMIRAFYKKHFSRSYSNPVPTYTSAINNIETDYHESTKTN